MANAISLDVVRLYLQLRLWFKLTRAVSLKARDIVLHLKTLMIVNTLVSG